MVFWLLASFLPTGWIRDFAPLLAILVLVQFGGIFDVWAYIAGPVIDFVLNYLQNQILSF